MKHTWPLRPLAEPFPENGTRFNPFQLSPQLALRGPGCEQRDCVSAPKSRPCNELQNGDRNSAANLFISLPWTFLNWTFQNRDQRIIFRLNIAIFAMGQKSQVPRMNCSRQRMPNRVGPLLSIGAVPQTDEYLFKAEVGTLGFLEWLFLHLRRHPLPLLLCSEVVTQFPKVRKKS